MNQSVRNLILFLSMCFAIKSFAMGKKIILSIGNNQYGGTGFKKLNYANSDAKKIYEYFKNLGFVGEPMWQDASYQATTTQLQAILNNKEIGVDDTVIIYFSGHGERKIEKGKVEKRLILSDSYYDKNGNLQNYIKSSDIVSILEKIRARRVALIMDSCKSGPFELPGNIKGRVGEHQSQFLVLSATTDSGNALEHSLLEGGVFTHFLIEAMKDKSTINQTLLGAYYDALYNTMEFTKDAEEGQQIPSKVTTEVGFAPIFVNSYVNEEAFKNVEVRYEKLGGLPKGGKIYVDNIKLNFRNKGDDFISFSKGGVKRLEVYDENNNLIHTRLITLEDGNQYTLGNLIGLPRTVALEIGAKKIRLDSNSYDGFTLRYKYLKNDWVYYVSMTSAKGKHSANYWGTNLNIDEQIYQAGLGVEINYPLFVLGWSEIGLKGQGELSYLYLKSTGDSFYFDRRNGFLKLPGSQATCGLRLKNGDFELSFSVGSGYYSNFRGEKLQTTSFELSGATYLW